MLTKNDITDIICRRLGLDANGAGPVPALSKASAPLPRRVFLSGWELKRLLKPGAKTLTVPSNSIISPLALDWLDYDGIEIIRE
jgi:hypothetical protein